MLLREKKKPLLAMRAAILYIPEALVLTEGFLQTDDDEHLMDPLLLPPGEAETNNKHGCICHGDFKSGTTQAPRAPAPSTK